MPINSCDFSPETYSFDEADLDYDLVHFDDTVAIDASRSIPMIQAAQLVHRVSSNTQSQSHPTRKQASDQLHTDDFDDSLRMKQSGESADLHSLKLVASPWSPPAWMKTNNNMLHGGHLNKTARDAWARYIVKWLDAYASYGVSTWGLTVQNEPESSQQWESCEYTAHEEASFVSEFLGPRVRAAYPTMKLFGFDHNKDHLVKWAGELFGDAHQSFSFLDGIAFHWYGGSCRSQVENVSYSFPSKILLPTEACYELTQGELSDFDQSQFVAHGTWARGEGYGHDIIVDIEAGAAGWTDWNLLLDEVGGPNHVHNYCDAPILADTSTHGGRLYYHPQYYYMGHFSKFVPPGSRRLHVDMVKDRVWIQHDQAGDKSSSDDDTRDQSMLDPGTSSQVSPNSTADCRGWPFYGRCSGLTPKFTAFRRPDGRVALVFMNCADSADQLRVELGDRWYFQNPFVPPHSIQTYVLPRLPDADRDIVVLHQRVSYSLLARGRADAALFTGVIKLLVTVGLFVMIYMCRYMLQSNGTLS